MLAIPILASCATLGTFQTADTLPAGQVMVALEPYQIATFSRYSQDSGGRMGLAVHVGVAEGTEVGLRTLGALPEVMVKRRLFRADGGTTVSLAPSAGGLPPIGQIPYTLVYGQIPLLIGTPTGRGTELVAGPKVHAVTGINAEGPGSGSMVTLGSSFGWSVPMIPGIRLLPEVAAGWPAVATGPLQTTVGGGIVIQGGVGLLVGGS